MSSIVGHQRILKTSSFDPFVGGCSKSSHYKVSYVQKILTVYQKYPLQIFSFPAALLAMRCPRVVHTITLFSKIHENREMAPRWILDFSMTQRRRLIFLDRIVMVQKYHHHLFVTSLCFFASQYSHHNDDDHDHDDQQFAVDKRLAIAIHVSSLSPE